VRITVTVSNHHTRMLPMDHIYVQNIQGVTAVDLVCPVVAIAQGGFWGTHVVMLVGDCLLKETTARFA